MYVASFTSEDETNIPSAIAPAMDIVSIPSERDFETLPCMDSNIV